MVDKAKPENSKKTLNEALHQASFFLSQENWDGNLARNYWMYLFDWDLNQLVKNLHKPLRAEELRRYEDAIRRIVQFEPIQYISGFGYFMDDKFKVSPATLIPREETAGLVEACYPFLKEKPTARVLEIGTGTGIIAIKLKKKFPDIEVWASDISDEALKVAKENARAHQVEINFLQSDVFEKVSSRPVFDLIVSNPPYIGENESDLVDKSVSKFEPTIALWAENDGLAIYEAIAKDLKHYLAHDGMAAFEIGFQQGAAVQEIMQANFPAAEVEVGKDFNQLDRYVTVHLSERR